MKHSTGWCTASVISSSDLASFTSAQLNAFFPDGQSVVSADLRPCVDVALQRLEYSFQHYAGGPIAIDVLHSDRYCMYVYLLSNTVYKDAGNTRLAGKLFYLNKALHAFNCMYDAELPAIFLLIHVVGTVLGKASTPTTWWWARIALSAPFAANTRVGGAGDSGVGRLDYRQMPSRRRRDARARCAGVHARHPE